MSINFETVQVTHYKVDGRMYTDYHEALLAYANKMVDSLILLTDHDIGESLVTNLNSWRGLLLEIETLKKPVPTPVAEPAFLSGTTVKYQNF